MENVIEGREEDDGHLERVAQDEAADDQVFLRMLRLSAKRVSKRQFSTLNHWQTGNTVKVSVCPCGSDTPVESRYTNEPSVDLAMAGVMNAMRESNIRVRSGSCGEMRRATFFSPSYRG